MPIKKKAIVKKSSTTKDISTQLDFAALVNAIQQVHEESASFVNRTVNTTLTLRNWVIGGYIREYEQRGADRAQYGTRLWRGFLTPYSIAWIVPTQGVILGFVVNSSMCIQKFGNQ